jgi:tRNA (guanine37-N1)-methyltransferase
VRIDILTLFPPLFQAPFGYGVFKRAIDNGLVTVNLINIRDYTHDKHHTADDYPYGGGAGMVMKPEPIFEAVDEIKANAHDKNFPVILLSPQGRLFSHKIALELSLHSHIVLICGHYEGIDERVPEHLATDCISIGDYVLTGGEVPALVVADAVLRLVPGVLGSEESPLEESHAAGLLEYPQYTRPPEFRGLTVPEVLLSGNHARIAKWRREQIIKRTLERRPELLDRAELGKEDKLTVERILHPESAEKASAGRRTKKDRES